MDSTKEPEFNEEILAIIMDIAKTECKYKRECSKCKQYKQNNCYDITHSYYRRAKRLYDLGYRKPVVAKWKTREACNDFLWVECSNCGFLVENYKAIKIGRSSTDVVGYKWHSCPKCSAKMIMPEGE